MSVRSLHPRRASLRTLLLGLVLVALIGLAVYEVYWHLWAGYHYRAAEQAVQRRDFEQAQSHLALCLQVWPRSAETHFLAARTARRAGSYDEARQHLAACKKLQWVPEAIDLEYALLLAQQGDTAPVEVYLLSCVHKDHPDSELILEALARGYLQTFQLTRALECLDLWLERQPDEVQALAWRGEVLERLDRHQAALEDYRRVVDLDAGRDDTRLRLADLLLRKRQPREALTHYEEVYRRQPGNAEALLGLALCQREVGQLEEARQLLDQLLAVEPRNPRALTARGQVASERGQLPEAEEWLRRAVTVVPFERDTVYAFEQCLHRRGKTDEAKEWHARLERIDADLKRMNELVAQVHRSPHDPALRCEAGVLLLRNGQEKEGLRWLASALRQNPAHAQTHQVLADYFERHGEPELAAQHRQQGGQ
jgi:predicted Zn-dependent protease